MAWRDDGSHYTWDVDYPNWAQAAKRAIELKDQYNVFTETTETEEKRYAVITQNTITEAHSLSCCCKTCW